MDSLSPAQITLINGAATVCLGVVVGLLIAGNWVYVRKMVGEGLFATMFSVTCSAIFFAIGGVVFWKYLL